MFHRKRLATAGLLLAAAFVFAAAVEASNWPHWRGPNRDGKSPDTGLLKSWPEGGPKRLWKQTGLGRGYSNVIVVDGVVFASGVKDGKLNLYAYDEEDGELQWERAVAEGHTGRYPGSRSTPTYQDGRLYVISTAGEVLCLDAKDGSEIWSREMSDFGGKRPHWGFAESVLALDDKIIITPGGKCCLVALDPKNGKTLWQGLAYGAAHYTSGINAEYEGVEMIIAGTRKGLIAVDPENGKTLWTDDFAANNTVNCPTPAFADGRVFWAVGYGKGGVCLKLDVTDGKVTAERDWTTKKMVCHHGGYVIVDGYIYGNHNNGWVCLDLENGDVQWEEQIVGKGSISYADGMLYLFGEKDGQVALVKASPRKCEVTGRFQVEGRDASWAHPVIINGKLLLRYDDNLYCYDVAAK
jgi:outer membrane protein assembly factor BamB